MTPRMLSQQLRHADAPHLRRRRGIAVLSFAAAGSMAYIALYQLGAIRHLADPPLPRMDSDAVDASDEAYQYASTPDAFLGFVSYGITASLTAMAEAERPRSRPWVPLALAGKVLFDVAGAAKLTWDQWAKHKAFCVWCLLATACTFGMLPLVMPEAREALRTLTGTRASEGRTRRRGERLAPLHPERQGASYFVR